MLPPILKKMEKFDIEIEIQEPTKKQLGNENFMIRHRMIVKEAKFYRETLLRVLNDKIDFSTFPEKEILIIKFRRTGSHKIEYSSIKNRKAKSIIKRVTEDSHPLVC
jgi:hypothetical protein